MVAKPKIRSVKLSVPQAQAFERLSALMFLTAANMERDEKLLKGLVTKKLARMTRLGSAIGFIRDVGEVDIVPVGTDEEVAAYKSTKHPPVGPVKKARSRRK